MPDQPRRLLAEHPAERFAAIDITARRARLVVVAIHVPFVAFLGIQAVAGADTAHPGRPLQAIPLLVALVALQLRHSLAAVEGERPRHWPWTFAALVVLCVAPALAWTYNWATSLWFIIASSAMLLPRRLAAIGIVAPVLGVALLDAGHVYVGVAAGPSLAQGIWVFVYTVVVFALGGLGLYGGVRVVRTVVELDDTRATLAEMAVTRERLRMARDLHDVLGHSLSAVSLKGDLALRLLDAGQARARAEVEDLTDLARNALRDVRAVALDERDVTVARELAGTQSLLGAAGITSTIAVDVGDLDPRADAVLGWAVREGVTNLLRHSDATACSITAGADGGLVHLDIVNDGATGVPGRGTGLDGLRARAAAVGGDCEAGPTGDGRFHLRVVVPRFPA